MCRHATPPIRRPPGRPVAAFSLIELVLVLAIIGILAAIAIPRFSRGQTAAAQTALSADLNRLRSAITTYAIEHKGIFPGPDAAGFVAQLTRYTSLGGGTSATKTTTYRFGPYLQAIPPCPVGENAGQPKASAVLISATSPPTPNPASGEGWVYNPATGEILPNTNMTNEKGTKFIEAEAEAISGAGH